MGRCTLTGEPGPPRGGGVRTVTPAIQIGARDVPLEKIAGQRPMRQRLALWLPRFWLPAVVLVSVMYWVLANILNPAVVPTLVVVALFWIWMWTWYRVHHLVPEFRVTWFGAYATVVVLSGIGALWSVGYAIARDHALLRARSPDGGMTVVVSGYPGSREFRVNTEALGGLVIVDWARIEYGADPAYWLSSSLADSDDRPAAPGTFSLRWSADPTLVALLGDGRLDALFRREGGSLTEQAEFRFQPTRIAAAFATPNRP
jgi:hypothetical protein